MGKKNNVSYTIRTLGGDLWVYIYWEGFFFFWVLYKDFTFFCFSSSAGIRSSVKISTVQGLRGRTIMQEPAIEALRGPPLRLHIKGWYEQRCRFCTRVFLTAVSVPVSQQAEVLYIPRFYGKRGLLTIGGVKNRLRCTREAFTKRTWALGTVASS